MTPHCVHPFGVGCCFFFGATRVVLSTLFSLLCGNWSESGEFRSPLHPADPAGAADQGLYHSRDRDGYADIHRTTHGALGAAVGGNLRGQSSGAGAASWAPGVGPGGSPRGSHPVSRDGSGRSPRSALTTGAAGLRVRGKDVPNTLTRVSRSVTPVGIRVRGDQRFR